MVSLSLVQARSSCSVLREDENAARPGQRPVGGRRGRRSRRHRVRPLQPRAGDRRARAPGRWRAHAVRRAPGAVRLAPRHAARGRDDAGVLPQGPGHAAQPAERVQLPVLPARSQDRLVDFINYGSVFPTRLEFHDYLEWVAARFAGTVDYGTEVVEVVPVREGAGPVEAVDVVCRDLAGTKVLRARNVVLATGLVPHVPDGVTLGPRVWHIARPAHPRRVRWTAPGPAGSPSSAPGRARRRPSTTCTARSPTPRSARCSPATATARPTTARSPTGSSTRAPSTTSTPRRSRSRT